MQLSRKQTSPIRFIKLPVVQIIGLIAVLQIGVACAPIKALMASPLESNISEVTNQLRTINEADNKHYLRSDDGKPLEDLVEEGLLAAVPQPPQGVGLEYHGTWRTAPTGTNKKMQIEYIELLGVSDDFCKAWNNAKHPELGMVIMPSCQEAKAPYTCAVSKFVVKIEDKSPPDQCDQTCCIAGNVILYRNGYVNKKD